MKSSTLTYTRQSGWSDAFPALDSPNTLVLVFAAADYYDDPEPLAEVSAMYPNSVVMGCSTAGEVRDGEVDDHSIVVSVTAFESTTLQSVVTALGDPSESREAGQTIATELARPDLAGVFILSEGLSVNGSELARGISSVLGSSVVVTGGLAADLGKFERTWVLSDGVPTVGVVHAVGFAGSSINIGYGLKGGWDIFGPQRKVTRAAGNVVFELDGEPALDLYERYLGELASDLPGAGLLFPLAVWNEDPSDQVVRTLLGVDRATGSVTFAGDVEEGAWAQLMQANFDRLVEGAEGAALSARLQSHDREVLALAVSCVGRKLVLGDRVDDEVEASLAVLPPGSTQVGFYSFGELSPNGVGTCDLHNQTMTITVLSES